MNGIEIIEFIKTAIPLPLSFFLGMIGAVFILYSAILISNKTKGKKPIIIQIIGSICLLCFMPVMVNFLTL